MIHIRRAADRGRADFGWLQARYTFSFAQYFDPDFVQFGPLRVLNQDRIAPRSGFPTHGHENMEIVTYVLRGVLEHRDDTGATGRIHPGEVQLMSAGSGIQHSERNPADDELELLQMWVLPKRTGTAPGWDQKEFPADERLDRLRLCASPDGRDGSLTIKQDALLHAGILRSGARVEHALAPGRIAWLHLPRGEAVVNGETLAAGDGAGIREETGLVLESPSEGELVLWDLPDQGGAPGG